MINLLQAATLAGCQLLVLVLVIGARCTRPDYRLTPLNDEGDKWGVVDARRR